MLGWTEAPVRVVRDLADARRALEVERDENVCRVDPTPSDLVGLGRQLEELELAAARERLEEGHRRGGGTAGRGRPKGRHGETYRRTLAAEKIFRELTPNGGSAPGSVAPGGCPG